MLYKELISQAIVNGKTEARVNSYEAINIDKGNKQLLSQLLNYDWNSKQWKDLPLSPDNKRHLIDGK
ncbi:hypothetical protein WAE56_19970 [Iodobacter sp. LRB]|uniref:hypothetical protein n=1 Tax=unclassified Iodobacter TaxID=235634 RepID=UPI000C0CB4F5|nr:hypothetical protein [Iodobacter sp. BJB302]PHU99691.1 hypothetical protein CSQ88_21210 [Iodobacter sp. BJB302]